MLGVSVTLIVTEQEVESDASFTVQVTVHESG